MKKEELLQNKELREENLGRVEVLDQVKKLLLLGDTEFATTEMVAEYYGVEKDTIKKLLSRHKEEISSNGYKFYAKKEIMEILRLQNATLEITIPNRGLNLFSKRAILNVGMLLTDSKVAEEIKQKITGFSNSNLIKRKEIKFKDELDKTIEYIKRSVKSALFFDEYYDGHISELHETILKALDNILRYKTQYCCCDNKYRIDFYFPKLNVAIEYDENYHKSQLDKDKKREYEIARYIYIYENKYYDDYNITQKDLEEWELSSIEELFDIEYEDNQLFYSFDLTKFIRVKEGNELDGILYATSMLTSMVLERIKARGMRCKYDDLLN